MICPYCNGEMRKGKFTYHTFGIWWNEVINDEWGRPRDVKESKRPKEEHSDSLCYKKLEGNYCESCKKIIIESELV